MPGVTRDGDATTTGHLCDITTTVTSLYESFMLKYVFIF